MSCIVAWPFINNRKYAAANISTNLYVISEPWLYSLAWCAGAHSVATNAVHILKNLQRPLFLMVNDTHLQLSGICSSSHSEVFSCDFPLSLRHQMSTCLCGLSLTSLPFFSLWLFLCFTGECEHRIYIISLWLWTFSFNPKSLCTPYKRQSVDCQSWWIPGGGSVGWLAVWTAVHYLNMGPTDSSGQVRGI